MWLSELNSDTCTIDSYQQHIYTYTGATSRCCAGYGRGSGSIWLDDVQCDGTERRLLNCTSQALGTHNCGHSEDAGVTCTTGNLQIYKWLASLTCIVFLSTSYTVCSNGDIRLSGGRNGTEGLVEICSGSTWGTVCDDFWGATDAQVVCNQLGFARTGLHTPLMNVYT